MALLSRIFDRLLLVLGAISGVVISAIAVLITLDIVLRNAGVSSFPWLLEITEYVLFAMTFLAAPWVLAHNAHVRVDLLVSTLPKKAGYVCELLADCLGFFLMVVMAWYGARIALDSYSLNSLLHKELVVSEWLLLIVIPIASTLLAIEFIRRIYRASRQMPVQPQQSVGGL